MLLLLISCVTRKSLDAYSTVTLVIQRPMCTAKNSDTTVRKSCINLMQFHENCFCKMYRYLCPLFLLGLFWAVGVAGEKISQLP